MNDQLQNEEVEPKCPNCGASGIEHFASRESKQQSRTREPWFFVIYCNKCGHVHGVISKHVFSQSSTHVVVPQ